MEKFSITEDELIRVFRVMEETEGIVGQVNLIKRRYTKRRVVSSEAIVGEIPVVSRAEEVSVTDFPLNTLPNISPNVETLKIEPPIVKKHVEPFINKSRSRALTLVHLLDSGDTFKEISLIPKKKAQSLKPKSKLPLTELLGRVLPLEIESDMKINLDTTILPLPEQRIEDSEESFPDLDIVTPIHHINVSTSPLTLILEIQQLENNIDKLNVLLQKLDNDFKSKKIDQDFYIEKKMLIAERLGSLQGIKEGLGK